MNIKNQNYNSSTVDVVAVQVTIDATDRAGVSNVDGTYEAGVVPKGAIIQKVYLDVTEAFDGTTPTIALGTTGTPEKWMAATAVTSTGVTAGSLLLDTKVGTTEDITLTLVNGSSTVGRATAYIMYVDTAARREFFTV